MLPSEVVLDDIIELGPGDQIVVDGEIVEEANLEVDESLLTGEADPIAKDAGDKVMSGSFVVAGSGAYRATKVGREAYAAKLAEEASKFTLVKSELRSGINKILQFITYLLIPAGLLIIYTQLFTTDAGWRESVLRMVGALVPMVPEGLVLMTSIAFAVGVVRLGRRQCLVNELPAIEGLARVDVVCADKTGTLTENGMRVSDLEAGCRPKRTTVAGDVLAQLAADDPRPNASMQAIAEAYKMPPGWTRHRDGAVQVGHQVERHVLRRARQLGDRRARRAARPGVPGRRAGRADRRAGPAGAAARLQRPARRPPRRAGHRHAGRAGGARAACPPRRPRHPGLLCRAEGFDQGHLRRQRGVGGRGGAARSACRARRWTPASCPTSPTQLADTLEEYTTFGRVRPDQKRAMVHALQSRGHTVAMTGDGVNDVLALKDADIGVAMGSGSAASRAVAQIVLLDNKFATLPYVVGEGRRVIGNIERVSNLFLTKTVYSVLLAILVGLAGLASKIFGSDPLLFPFQPIHVTIAAWFTIGIPAFILSLAPNNERAHPGFVRRVMTSALPSGLVVGVATFTSYLVAYQGREATPTRADAGVDGGADHVAGDRGVGAGGGGAAVRVVAGGAGRASRVWPTW